MEAQWSGDPSIVWSQVRNTITTIEGKERKSIDWSLERFHLKMIRFPFQTVHSKQSLKDHYVFCSGQNRLPFPATFVILISFNNLFLVFNSSINFVIYCAIRDQSYKTVLPSLIATNNEALSYKENVPTLVRSTLIGCSQFYSQSECFTTEPENNHRRRKYRCTIGLQ